MSNCDVFTFLLVIGFLGQAWCLIVSIFDLCVISYFESIKTNINRLSKMFALLSKQKMVLQERTFLQTLRDLFLNQKLIELTL